VRVLVTGAGGFIGSHVVRCLLAEGDEVAVIVRPGNTLRRLNGLAEQLTRIRGDLGDPNDWRKRAADWQPEACIHAAWYAEPGLYLDSTENLGALRYSLDLIEELGRAGCRHLVGVGTCFEYEMGDAPLREDSPTRPATLYAASKLAFSLVAAQRLAQLGVGMAWSRLFYIYGPYEDERRLVPSAIKALLAGREFPSTSGEQVRDYLHVEDVASALCALSRLRLEGVFNVCSETPVTIAGLMQNLGELLGRPELIRLGAFPYRQWEPMYVCGDNQRLRNEAQWSPRYTLRDGLASTVDWWKGAQ
jgi:nucleoside-diphosphate-sugar epimerase